MSDASQSVPKDSVITIGHAGPLTGTIGHLGVDNENGVRLAIEDINAAGGIRVKDRTYQLRLISVDDRADPRTAVVQAARLANEYSVVAVVGHLNSGTSIPASKIYFGARIPAVSPSATHPKLTSQGFDTSFRLIANDDRQGSALAVYAIERLMAKRIAVIDDGTPYGSSLAQQFVAALRTRGVQIVGRETGQDGQTDFALIVSRLRRSEPDLVFYGGMDLPAAHLALQWPEVLLLTGDGACSPTFIEKAQRAGESMHCSQPGEAVQALADGPRFAERYRRRFGAEVQIYSPYAYDATFVIADAIQRAGSTDANAIISAMRSTAHAGITGPISFDGQGDVRDGAVSLFRVRNGSLEYVESIRQTRAVSRRPGPSVEAAGLD